MILVNFYSGETAGMIFNERDQELRDLGYQKHAFNMLISNRLGYHRDVPDTRNAAYVSRQCARLTQEVVGTALLGPAVQRSRRVTASRPAHAGSPWSEIVLPVF